MSLVRLNELKLTCTTDQHGAYLQAIARYRTQVKPPDDETRLFMLERIIAGTNPFDGLPECIGME